MFNGKTNIGILEEIKKKKKKTQILHLMLPGCITAWSWESSATIHAQMFEFGDIHYL